MKKVLLTLLVAVTCSMAANCQVTNTTSPQLTKEEKAAMKAKQENDLTSSFKEAELTQDQIDKARTVLAEANKKSNELKTNTAMSEADKAVEKKKINDEKNAKLKEIMGDKYKTWTAIRKKQKEASTDK